MSIQGKLIETVFGGNADPFNNIKVQVGDGTSPNGVITSPKGTFLYVDYPGNDTDGDVYLNTNGGTAWTQIRNPV